MKLSWWIFMLALPLIHSDTDWSSCPTICKCMWNSGKMVAECTSQGLTTVPDHLSTEIQSIDLSNNALHSLPSKAFSAVGLINLHKIFLRECGIQELHKDTFKGLHILIELDLSHNIIHYIHPETFRDNVRLRVLHMHHNPITQLDDGLFTNMTYLHKVDMTDCRLVNVGDKTFVNVPALRHLLLAGNKLVHMNIAAVEHLDRLISLVLHHNPWSCDCHLKAFRDWTIEKHLYEKPNACASPPHLANRLWTDIPSNDFDCRPHIIYPEMTTVAYGEEVTLSSKLNGNPEPGVYGNLNSGINSISTRSIGTPGNEFIVDDIVYVGCYDLEYSIDQNFHQPMRDPNLEKCSSYCCRLKTQYAGIEKNDNFCYCGNEIAEKSRKQDASLCNVSCSDAELQRCGGESLMSLYNISGVNECAASGKGNSIQAPGTSFLIGTQSDIRKYNIDDVHHFDILISANERVVSVDYHLAKRLVFYYSNNTLYQTTMEPSVSSIRKTPTPITTTTRCDAIAVDWVYDKILFCDNSTIMSMDLGGGERTVLYHHPRKGLIARMEVDPFEGILFWSIRGTIESYQYVEPKHFRGNLSDEELYVRTLALDMSAHRVYYLAEVGDSPALFSVNYQGGDYRRHMSVSQFGFAYGMGVVQGHVFWLSYVNSMDELYGAPLPLNGTDSVKKLAAIDRAVWHMKVIHPDLQKRPSIDSARTTPALHV